LATGRGITEHLRFRGRSADERRVDFLAEEITDRFPELLPVGMPAILRLALEHARRREFAFGVLLRLRRGPGEEGASQEDCQEQGPKRQAGSPSMSEHDGNPPR